MLTSDDYANLLSDSTQLVSARRAYAGQRGIWRLLARRLRTFGQLPASRAYAEFLNGLSASEYADLAGAYLANGFVHYGAARLPVLARCSNCTSRRPRRTRSEIFLSSAFYARFASARPTS